MIGASPVTYYSSATQTLNSSAWATLPDLSHRPCAL